jgi:putative drug exporter of the RND superfamily
VAGCLTLSLGSGPYGHQRVMIAVFAIFASLSTLDMNQLGVGLGVAELIDATLIRGPLLPAPMKLLGRSRR